MRDGIAVARRGRAAVAIVTAKFQAQGDFVARASGMSAIPRAVVPHPVAGIGAAAMRALATVLVPVLVRRLREG